MEIKLSEDKARIVYFKLNKYDCRDWLKKDSTLNLHYKVSNCRTVEEYISQHRDQITTYVYSQVKRLMFDE